MKVLVIGLAVLLVLVLLALRGGRERRGSGPTWAGGGDSPGSEHGHGDGGSNDGGGGDGGGSGGGGGD
ncbi:hypothetical protein ABZ686_15415 [Streptomyces sp. NPDC006992]|uniref:hypothetical protein n=1 Tax=Streptomyces sp. NPDC006992 TaxID=3155601 RepID=UPI0033EF3B4E